MLTETGKLIYVGATDRGVSTRTGTQWAAQEFVIETPERMPRKIAFSLFGEEKITRADLKVGEMITVVGWPESHEFNNSWYTELRVSDILDGQVSRLNRIAGL